MKTALVSQVLLCSLLLSACSTTSFAPPMVARDKVIADRGSCPAKTASDSADITENVEGALRLVENHISVYECTQAELADGRQIFEVPSALALAGGATAAALGAGSTVAIATGAGAATLGRGNSYYAPKDKAQIVAAAYDAVVCIKQEASGITALNVEASQLLVDNNTGGAKMVGAGSVRFSPEFQYYQMVSSSLDDVRAILAGRMSSAGTYAPKLLAQEITDLSKEVEQAQSAATANATASNVAAITGGSNEDPILVKGLLELGELQPKLELCVVRAKVG